MSDARFVVIVDRSNPAVKDRINAMNAAFRNAKGDTVYFVNSSACPEYTRCLEQQAYNDRGEPDKTKDTDHGNDAGGYYIAKEYPVRRPMGHNSIRMAF